MTTDKETSATQAQAQLDGIRHMVNRLEHAQSCTNGDDCDLDLCSVCGETEAEHDNEACKIGEFRPETDWGALSDGGCDTRDEYHDADKAREAIEGDALSVEVRSGWTSPGEEMTADEFCILLCTGGPAVRILGELNKYQEPSRVWMEHQDWFTPWQEFITTGEDHRALLEYARCFWFGS